MKKNILSTALLTLLSTSVIFGQTKPQAKPQFTFCNFESEGNELTIKYADIYKCYELFPIDKNFKIKNFRLGYVIDGGATDKIINGSKLSGEFVNLIKDRKIKWMAIEPTVLDGTTERKLGSLVVKFSETAPTTPPIVKETLINEVKEKISASISKFEKEKIFSTITGAVLSGKLKAYEDYPGKALTVKEFKDILFRSDSTLFEDPNNPGVKISAPISTLNQKYYQLRFNEKIALDTANFTLSTKVATITFFTYKYTESGECTFFERKLFEVKLND